LQPAAVFSASDRSIMTERIARRGRHVHREYGVDPLRFKR